MNNQLSESMQQNLWRNHLVKLYSKYWSELQNAYCFQYGCPNLLAGKLGKIADKMCPSVTRYDSPQPAAKAARRLEKEADALGEERGKVGENFEKLSEHNQQKDLLEFKSTTKILEVIEEELGNLKVKIIIHPNREIEFVDMDTELVLKLEN